MKQEDVILSSIMDIKEDIGVIKGTQAGMQVKMDTLDKSMESLELTCAPSPAIQVSKNQVLIIISAILCALGGLGATV